MGKRCPGQHPVMESGTGARPVDTPDGAAVFELERFDWDDDGRLEVSGRWFGLRARRFVRPTLTLRAEGARRRLLAVLDHKPWAAEDGEPWTAAFAPDGDLPEIEGADLAVA